MLLGWSSINFCFHLTLSIVTQFFFTNAMLGILGTVLLGKRCKKRSKLAQRSLAYKKRGEERKIDICHLRNCWKRVTHKSSIEEACPHTLKVHFPGDNSSIFCLQWKIVLCLSLAFFECCITGYLSQYLQTIGNVRRKSDQQVLKWFTYDSIMIQMWFKYDSNVIHMWFKCDSKVIQRWFNYDSNMIQV